LADLIRQVTGQQVTEFEQLTMEEQIEVTDELKKFTILCMRCYSINFRREKIKGVEDILWFGRIGNARYYKGTDRDVKEGRAKSGDRKPGLQLHVHIIVSRNDVTQTVTLCPLANSRGSVNILNGKKGMIGFDRWLLAELADLRPATISNVENGKFSVGIDILTKICNTLGARIEIVKE
jgi:DNA-binding XRE family transcriptional regulator